MALKEVMHNGSILTIDPKEEPVVYDGSLEGYIGKCEHCDQPITLMSKTLYEFTKNKYIRYVVVTNPDKVKDVNKKFGEGSFQKSIEAEFLTRWPEHVCGQSAMDIASQLDKKDEEIKRLQAELVRKEKVSVTGTRNAEHK